MVSLPYIEWLFGGLKGALADQGCFVLLGAKGVEYPQRFFARDFAGNRLEFSL